MPDPLPDALVELIAERFRVIGDPTRIRVLERLRRGEASVQELTDVIG
jgi:DNA-binding transcriptional ArsR family regulator